MSISGVTIKRNGYTYTYDPIISVDLRYRALLTQEFVRNQDVTMKGEYGELMIRGKDDVVLWDTGAARVERLSSIPIDVELHTDNPGPYHTYFILYWFYPNVGVFVKTFRVGTNKRVTKTVKSFRIDFGSSTYQAALANARRSLSQAFKKRGGTPKSGVRPATEYGYTTSRIYFDYTSHPLDHSDTTETWISYARSWTGSRTPGYWSKRRQQLPVNGHTVVIADVHADVCYRHQEWPHPENPALADRLTQIKRCTSWWSIPAGRPSISGAADLPALSRLRDKMGADFANLAQDIGEVRETIGMIHKTIQRIHNANAALRAGNFPGAISALWSGRDSLRGSSYARKALSFTKSLAENWLELQYGWKPLLNDVHDALEKSSRLFNTPGDFIIAQASGSATVKSEVVTPIDSTYAPLGQGKGAGKHTLLIRQRTKYGVRFKVADAHKAFLAQTGFTNPVDLIWELLPYSFVVDWFLSVGPWLESFTAFQGLEFVDGYKTQFQRSNIYFFAHAKYVVPPSVSQECHFTEDAMFLKEWVEVNRVKLSAWPLPSLPHFKSPWSTGHVLNGLALLAAGFKESSKWHT